MRTEQAQCDEEELKAIRSLGLLTLKRIIYAANVVDEELASGNEMVEKVREYAAKEGAEVVIVSAQVESEIAELSSEEKAEFLDALGVTDPNSCGLNALTRQAFRLLNLQTYFTTGPQETRAWTITKGMKAPQASAHAMFCLACDALGWHLLFFDGGWGLSNCCRRPE